MKTNLFFPFSGLFYTRANIFKRFRLNYWLSFISLLVMHVVLGIGCVSAASRLIRWNYSRRLRLARRWTCQAPPGNISVAQQRFALLSLMRYSYAVRRLWHDVSSVCRLSSSSVTDVLWLNGAREGLRCCWSLTGSRVLAFKWHENRWPWMTLKGHNALWFAKRAVLWLNSKS